MGGSSGSPVISKETNKVIAIHHAGETGCRDDWNDKYGNYAV